MRLTHKRNMWVMLIELLIDGIGYSFH